MTRKVCILANIAPDLEFGLRSALAKLGCRVRTGTAQLDGADFVFAGIGDGEAWERTRTEVRDSAPLVAVGRDATTEAWISALDRGACDYLCEGFEEAELSWVLQSHRSHSWPVAS